MVRLLLAGFISLLLLGCKKEVKSSGFENLFNKLLICDSIRTETSSTRVVTIVGKGKGFDLLFTSTGNTGRYGTVGTYVQYSNPQQKVNFRYERPDKLYYWSSNITMYDGDYYTIQSVMEKNVTLYHLQIGTDNKMYYYFTAE